MTILVAVAAAALFGVGSFLLMQRRLTRVLLGLALLGHGSVLALLVAGGPTGDPAIVGGTDPGPFSDPLVQALALTAIVITFAVILFLLALANRSWELTGDDQVEDDVEDQRVASNTGVEELGARYEMVPDEREFAHPPEGDDLDPAGVDEP